MRLALAACLAAFAALPAVAAPITLIHSPPAGSTTYSIFVVDPSKLRNQSVAQARTHLVSQLTPLGLTPAYVTTDLNVTPVVGGPMHLGSGELWTYTNETLLPTVESPPVSLVLDRGVKQVMGANFRTPVSVTEPFYPPTPVHVHFDIPISTFGLLAQTSGGQGDILLIDTLRIEVQTDADHDGVLETLRADDVPTVGINQFVGVTVPSGFTDLTLFAIGGTSQAFLSDRFTYVPWVPTAGVGDGAPALALALGPATPSPSSGALSLRFALAASGPVRAEVYGADGRRVRTLASAWHAAGEHALAWDGRTQAGALAEPGVYFVRLSQGGPVATRKVIRVR